MDYIYQKPAWPCACVRAGARTLEVKNRRPWKTTNSTATIATWHTKGKKKMKKKKKINTSSRLTSRLMVLYIDAQRQASVAEEKKKQNKKHKS